MLLFADFKCFAQFPVYTKENTPNFSRFHGGVFLKEVETFLDTQLIAVCDYSFFKQLMHYSENKTVSVQKLRSRIQLSSMSINNVLIRYLLNG